MPDEPRAHERLPRAVVLGCAGERLTAEERGFFAAADPFGFVLFRRNCRARDQLRALVDELRASVGRPDAPVLVDQEGGRVARLQPPELRTPDALHLATALSLGADLGVLITYDERLALAAHAAAVAVVSPA